MTFQADFFFCIRKINGTDVVIPYIFITIFLMSLQFVETCVNI